MFPLILLLCAVCASAEDLRYFLVSEKGETTSVAPDRVERRNWPKGQVSTVPRPGWFPLSPGLESGSVRLWRSDTTGATLYLLRVSPEKFRFKVMGKAGPGQPLTDWLKAEGGIAGINGGYFFLKPGGHTKIPLGLTVKGGKTLSRYLKNYSGCFFVTHKGPDFAFNTPPPPAATEVVQSFPTLMSSGEIPEYLKTEVPGRLHIHVRRPRAAIGRDHAGNIHFFATQENLSFFELAFLAGVLGMRDCLALDGGGSVQMAAVTRPAFRMTGRDPVPIVIGVLPKE